MNKNIFKNLYMLATIIVVLMFSVSGCVMADNKGKFMQVGNLNIPRSGQTATLLKDGDVLIVGRSETAEIYVPKDKKFYKSGDLNIARGSHTATLLNDGRVLITGGYIQKYSDRYKANVTIETKTSEIYNPSSKEFTLIGNLNFSRAGDRSAILLNDGRVLIADMFHKEVEIYNPKDDKFKIIGTFVGAINPEKAVMLNNGKVLFIGGYVKDQTASAQIFDPTTNSFKYTGQLKHMRGDFTATLLKDGNLLIIGGEKNYTEIPTAELYDVKTGNFQEVGRLNEPRKRHQSILLPDGKVLVTGGETGHSEIQKYLKSVEIYDPTTKTFSRISNMHHPRSGHTMTELLNNQILIIGGNSFDKSSSKTAELFINK